MMKRIIFALLVLTMVSAVSASLCDDLMEELNLEVGTEFDKVVPYKNELFNVYALNGSEVGHIEIEDRIITSIGCDIKSDPTFNIYFKDVQTIKEIKVAQSPIDAFNDKLKSDDIRIEGASATKSVKGFFIKIGLKIASWFA